MTSPFFEIWLYLAQIIKLLDMKKITLILMALVSFNFGSANTLRTLMVQEQHSHLQDGPFTMELMDLEQQ